MKALCFQAIGQLELVDIPIPQVQPDYLLIKTGAATICTSDINDLRSNPFDIPLPVIIGHEAAGTVVGKGDAVIGFEIGDRVATHPVHSCGICQACQGGMQHLCLNMGHFGLNMQGTMAEYFVVRQDCAHRIAPEVDFALASLTEPVSVCLEALAQANLKPGGSLVIVGDGPFGVLMSHLAETMHLARVVIVGRQDYRLGFAGHVTKINHQGHENSNQVILDAAGGLGYDAAILAVGSSEAFSVCLRLLRPKGRLVVFSALPGDTPVDLFTVHVNELEIVGACNDQERFAEAVQMIERSGDSISKLITHRFPLNDFAQAFHLAEFGKDQAMKISFIF